MSLIFQWIKKLNSTFNEHTDIPKPSIMTDADGYIYVAYVTIQPSHSESNQTNIGLIDVVVVKFSPDGQIVWYRQQPCFGTSQDDTEPDMCIDPFGNIYVTYCTNGDISGQTEPVNSLDIVVFKLNPQGDTLWVKQSSSFNTVDQQYSPAISTDANGNAYVVYWTSTITQDHIVLFKLDTSGHHLWTKENPTFNTTGGNYHPSIHTDDTGNCYIAYWCDGQGQPASGETQTGNFDVVIVKTDANGNNIWIRQQPTFNTNEQDDTPSITIDHNNNCYVVFTTKGSTASNITAGYFDIAVTKLTSNGNILWTIQKPTFNTSAGDIFPSIAVDMSGLIYVTYCTYGVVDGQTVTGEPDVVVMQLDNDGNLLNIIQQPTFNTPYENVYPAISVDLYGNCYVAYYSISPVPGNETQELVVFKISTLICVTGETQVLMIDGTYKPIKDIQRGDIVAPGHQVSRLCYEKIDYSSKIDLMIFEKNCLDNFPNERLIITPNHPIIYKNARRPAKCFKNCPGVTYIKQKPINQITEFVNQPNGLILYDLQFDYDGSYIANGVEVQSRSPHSYHGPLPKELYFDQSLYSPDKVWDSLDHILPLDTTPLDFNILMLKNKPHTHIGLNYKRRANKQLNNTHSITKYITTY